MRERNLNHILYLVQNALYSILIALSSGSVFQSFMLESGIGENEVSVYVSVIQVAQLATMLLLSKAADMVKDVRKAVGLTLSMFLPFFLTVFFVCYERDLAVDVKYGILFGVSILLNLVLGFYMVISYKLPHHVMDIRDYGKITGVSGVVSGFACMLISMAIPFLLKRWDYFDTMSLFFGVGIVASIAVPIVCMKFKELGAGVIASPKQRINIFRYRPFYQLLIPNFMRGFSTGILNLITVIGYACGALDSATAAIVVVLTQAATLIGSQVYSLLAGRYRNGVLLLIATIAFSVAVSMMVVGNTTGVFLTCYFFAYFFMCQLSIGVPVLVANRIEYSCLGQYTAWRMALHTLGTALGGICVPILLNWVGAFGTLLVCGITMLPCGIGYYLFEKQCIKTA